MAGRGSTRRARSGAMHGRTYHLRELRYGFDLKIVFFLLDCFCRRHGRMEAFEFRVTIQAADELTIIAKVESGKLMEFLWSSPTFACLRTRTFAEVAFDKISKWPCKRKFADARSAKAARGVALWQAATRGRSSRRRLSGRATGGRELRLADELAV